MTGGRHRARCRRCSACWPRRGRRVRHWPPDISALLTPCGITPGAGLDPVHLFRPGGRRQHRRLQCARRRSRRSAGFPERRRLQQARVCRARWCRAASATGSFVDSTFGLRFHSDSAHLRGMKTRTGALAMAQHQRYGDSGAVAERHQRNPHNPMYGIWQAGARGALLDLIGIGGIVSGGNSHVAGHHDQPERAADQDGELGRRDRSGQHRPAELRCCPIPTMSRR